MLIGGHLADRRDRRSIILVTSAGSSLCAFSSAVVSPNPALISLAADPGRCLHDRRRGWVRAPGVQRVRAQVIPLEHAARARPDERRVAGRRHRRTGAGGLAVALRRLSATYRAIALVLPISTICVALIGRKPVPVPVAGERVIDSLTGGVRYVVRNQALLGSMALDLFAVFFGGAIALLPIFATDILNVGPIGLGLLRTAPSGGALLAMLVTTRYRPMRHAGPIFLTCVAIFGVSMLVFGVSTNFALSMAGAVRQRPGRRRERRDPNASSCASNRRRPCAAGSPR